MPSVKRIETTSADGKVRLATGDDGLVRVSDPTTRVGTDMVSTEIGVTLIESSLIEAVLEYAHERGLRRSRKAAKGNGAAKRTRTKPAAQHDPAVMI